MQIKIEDLVDKKSKQASVPVLSPLPTDAEGCMIDTLALVGCNVLTAAIAICERLDVLIEQGKARP